MASIRLRSLIPSCTVSSPTDCAKGQIGEQEPGVKGLLTVRSCCSRVRALSKCAISSVMRALSSSPKNDCLTLVVPVDWAEPSFVWFNWSSLSEISFKRLMCPFESRNHRARGRGIYTFRTLDRCPDSSEVACLDPCSSRHRETGESVLSSSRLRGCCLSVAEQEPQYQKLTKGISRTCSFSKILLATPKQEGTADVGGSPCFKPMLTASAASGLYFCLGIASRSIRDESKVQKENTAAGQMGNEGRVLAHLLRFCVARMAYGQYRLRVTVTHCENDIRQVYCSKVSRKRYQISSSELHCGGKQAVFAEPSPDPAALY